MTLTIAATKRLPHFTLEVDASLRCSGIHAVVGPSGAGKSTLLRLIAGLETPDSGFVRFKGEVWAGGHPGVHVPPWKRPVGMVSQDFALFPHLTLWGNVLFSASDTGLAQSLMQALGVWAYRDARPGQVSGGERQRCAVCQALARKPELLLLDEPFSALDPQTRRALSSLLRSAADDAGLPMVLVTHDLEEALSLGDSITTLVEGRISPGWLGRRIEELERDAARSRDLFRSKHFEERV